MTANAPTQSTALDASQSFPPELDGLIKSAEELAAQIRELEAAPLVAQGEIEKLQASFAAASAGVLRPVAHLLQHCSNRRAMLQQEEDEILTPYREQLLSIEQELKAESLRLAAESSNQLKKAKELRAELAAIMGEAWEIDGVQTRKSEQGDLQITVTKQIATADNDAAVATIVKWAPGGEFHGYLSPNANGLALIAGLVSLEQAKPVDVRTKLAAKFPGFTLELNFGPKLLKPKLVQEPQP